MSVKYVPSLGWIFDTPSEAAQFYRLVNGSVPVVKQGATGSIVQATFALTADGKRLIQELLKRHPESVPGRELAEHLGIKSSELGNVVVSIARWGEGLGLTRKDMISKRRARIGGGRSVRTLRLLPSFAKSIRSGKIRI